MIDRATVKGLLFDYGGTIDSNGVHWAEVIWQAYRAAEIPVDKAVFRDAYVHGERLLGRTPIVRPHHTFADMMDLKIRIQFDWLEENRFLKEKQATPDAKRRIANHCYTYAARSVEAARPVIAALSAKYPLVLVSNFYGNIAAVLKDFQLRTFFPTIIESAVVGVRKPDPQIFRLGVEALHLPAEKVVVVGDSYDKDIVPATRIGCQTIWLKKTGWSEYAGNETAGAIISDFAELKELSE